MNPARRRPLLWVAGLVLLAGCAQQRINDASRSALAGGDYEAAIRQLDGGLKEYPESVLLRTTLLQVRAEAQAQLVAEAAALLAELDVDLREPGEAGRRPLEGTHSDAP